MKLKHFMETYGAYRALKHLNKMHPMGMMRGCACHQMRRRHRVMAATTGLGSFALGMTVGCLLGVLFAPMRGEETRHELKQNGVRGTVDKVKSKIEDKLEDKFEKAPC